MIHRCLYMLLVLIDIVSSGHIIHSQDKNHNAGGAMPTSHAPYLGFLQLWIITKDDHPINRVDVVK